MGESPTAQQLTSPESRWAQIGSIAWLKTVVYTWILEALWPAKDSKGVLTAFYAGSNLGSGTRARHDSIFCNTDMQMLRHSCACSLVNTSACTSGFLKSLAMLPISSLMIHLPLLCRVILPRPVITGKLETPWERHQGQ